MVCLSCAGSRERNVCKYCGQCPHLCGLKCSQLTRIRKMKAMDRERRLFSDMEIVSIPIETDPLCDNCGKSYKVKHSLQRFCTTRCGRHVRNKHYRELRALRVGCHPRPASPPPSPQAR